MATNSFSSYSAIWPMTRSTSCSRRIARSRWLPSITIETVTCSVSSMKRFSIAGAIDWATAGLTPMRRLPTTPSTWAASWRIVSSMGTAHGLGLVQQEPRPYGSGAGRGPTCSSNGAPISLSNRSMHFERAG